MVAAGVGVENKKEKELENWSTKAAKRRGKP